MTLPPENLPYRAVRAYYCPKGSSVTEAECRTALMDCLAKGWMQVVDEPIREQLAEELRQAGCIGPIYGGLPEVGCVDFTHVGAAIHQRNANPSPCHFVYQDQVHAKMARFFRTKATAEAEAQEYRGQEGVVVSGPTPIGAWRAEWWRRFDDGYRVDREEWTPWQGAGCSGCYESIYLAKSNLHIDLVRLQQTLDRRNVTYTEWLVLHFFQNGKVRGDGNICRHIVESGAKTFGKAVSQEECRDALAAALQHGWLRRVDPQTKAEVRALLDADPVFLAVPRIAGKTSRQCLYYRDSSGQYIPVAHPAAYPLGEIDFTPEGAVFYRALAAESLGEDWEDALWIERTYYAEGHHYCTSQQALEEVVYEYIERGDNVLSHCITPIGPWCIQWWKRFPSGYRLEIVVGEPSDP